MADAPVIFKKYGSTFQSVDVNFDGNALNEIGFRRNRALQIQEDDFQASYARVGEHAFAAEAEGSVHSEVEQAALDDLETQLMTAAGGLEEGQVLVVENEQANDWPKTRQESRTVIEEGENRLFFVVRISPPLKVGVYSTGG